MAKTVKKRSVASTKPAKKTTAKKVVAKTKRVTVTTKKVVAKPKGSTAKITAKKVVAKAAAKKSTPAKKPAVSKKVVVKSKAVPTNNPLPKSKSRLSGPPVKLTANDNDVIANAKVRFGQKDLAFFKTELLKQREEAKEEFDIISQQLLDTTGEYEAENQSFALHTAEQGSDAMEREKQYLQAQRTSDFIKKLDEALERIERGIYGICVVCGELIEKPRLMAVPITQKHVMCKNKTNAKKFSVGEPGGRSEESVE